MCDITKEKLSENILQKRGLETIGWKEERDKIAKIELIKLWTNFKTFYDRYIHWVLRATILNGSGHLTPWERACSGCTYIRQKVIEGLSEEQHNLCVKNVDQVGAQGKVLSTTEVACRRKPRKSWSSRLWVLRSLSCKTTLPKEIHQKVSNAILRVMLGDERTAPSMATTGQSHQGAEVWIHRKGTYTPRTWKLQKYPCKNNQRIQQQNKYQKCYWRGSETKQDSSANEHQKMSLYQEMEHTDTSE